MAALPNRMKSGWRWEVKKAAPVAMVMWGIKNEGLVGVVAGADPGLLTNPCLSS